MATSTETTAAVKPKRTRKPKVQPPDVCSRAVIIRDTVYKVAVLSTRQAPGVVALVRLRRLDDPSITYHVSRHDDGTASCECADHHFRHEGNETDGCKHVKSLTRLGYLPTAAACWPAWTDAESYTVTGTEA